MQLAIKRIYELAGDDDGYRLLVDRLWPRGVSREAAGVDAWAKELAPSSELRKWFAHEPARFPDFRRRYRDELDASREKIETIMAAIKADKVTLLYSAKDTEHNQAVVLREWLVEELA